MKFNFMGWLVARELAKRELGKGHEHRACQLALLAAVSPNPVIGAAIAQRVARREEEPTPAVVQPGGGIAHLQDEFIKLQDQCHQNFNLQQRYLRKIVTALRSLRRQAARKKEVAAKASKVETSQLKTEIAKIEELIKQCHLSIADYKVQLQEDTVIGLQQVFDRVRRKKLQQPPPRDPKLDE